MGLVDRAVHGDRRALARLLTVAESGGVELDAALAELEHQPDGTHVIGITGSPGSGKSTLVGSLARELRARGETVGVVAVDPSSPFSGGAVLGDRVRMQELMGDPGVFIRSMANRGARGGLAAGTAAAVRVLAACGFTKVLVETVGAGQSEVDVSSLVDTTVVVMVPGMGDGVQAIKAGILEAADLLVVNKSDRSRADQLVAELEMLRDGVPSHGWTAPILKTIATNGEGVAELADALQAHRHYRERANGKGSSPLRNVPGRLMEAAIEQISAELREQVDQEEISDLSAQIVAGKIGLQSAAKELVRKYRNGFRANEGTEGSPDSSLGVRRGQLR